MQINLLLFIKFGPYGGVAKMKTHSKLCCILSIYLDVPISIFKNHVLRLTHDMYVDLYSCHIPIL